MDWLSTSYMGRKGVARSQKGTTHQLTQTRQGAYHYVYGPYAKPVLMIAPGDVAKTHDAFEGKIKDEKDLPSQVLTMPFVNPQNGPMAVSGAKKGDVLAVHILSILPRGPQPVGPTALIPEFGGLVATSNTAMLNPALAERVKKMIVTSDGIRFNDRIALPYEPFIGTLGVNPEIEAVSSLQPDYWGGNMDLPDVAPGAIVYFSVQHDDAYLYLGDCHGRQGDGELCGAAVEIPATASIQVDVIKGWSISRRSAGNRRVHHERRQRETDGRRRPDGLSPPHSLAGQRFWFRPVGGVFFVHASRSRAGWQYGGSEISARRLDAQILPQTAPSIVDHIAVERARQWTWDLKDYAQSSPAAAKASDAIVPKYLLKKVPMSASALVTPTR
jgi:amidase